MIGAIEVGLEPCRIGKCAANHIGGDSALEEYIAILACEIGVRSTATVNLAPLLSSDSPYFLVETRPPQTDNRNFLPIIRKRNGVGIEGNNQPVKGDGRIFDKRPRAEQTFFFCGSRQKIDVPIKILFRQPVCHLDKQGNPAGIVHRTVADPVLSGVPGILDPAYPEMVPMAHEQKGTAVGPGTGNLSHHIVRDIGADGSFGLGIRDHPER